MLNIDGIGVFYLFINDMDGAAILFFEFKLKFIPLANGQIQCTPHQSEK